MFQIFDGSTSSFYNDYRGAVKLESVLAFFSSSWEISASESMFLGGTFDG